MKQKLKAITVFCMVFAMLSAAFAVNSKAAAYIDVSADVTLSIEHIESSVPVAGESFKLYKIADVDRYGNFTPTSQFAACPVDLSAKTANEWKGIAGALESFALVNEIEPIDVAVTNSNGEAVFDASKLTTGLYLIGGTTHEQGKYKYISDPFCVTLPTNGENASDFIYDVTAKPKFSTKIQNDDEEAYITRKVHKVWKDSNSPLRPTEIVVNLLRDGAVFDAVTLNKDNSWSHTWQKLDPAYRWTVAEQVPSGYDFRITTEGITFLIENTLKDDEPEESTTSPEEGTTSPEEKTTSPEEGTTSPEEGTTSPEESTTSPEEKTTSPEESTTSPGDETTSPEEKTTSPEEKTTSPEEETTSPEEKTTSPEEKTTSPEEGTTAPNEGTTSPNENTTSPGEGTTSPENDITTPEEKTTLPDDNTTLPEEDTTKSEQLPYTGQLWWPVPMLIAGGLGFFVLGALKRRGYEDDE